MSRIKFLIEGFKHFKEIGTVTRSGHAMCEQMVAYIGKKDKYIVELGAGDGVITRHILEKMSPDGKLLSFEINETLYSQLNNIDDPRLIAINDSAEKMDEYMAQYNMTKLDAVMSAIPYLVLPQELATDILEKCKAALKSGAPYTQVHYGKGLKDFYQGVFGNLKIHFILKNIPPAYVFYCIKED